MPENENMLNPAVVTAAGLKNPTLPASLGLISGPTEQLAGYSDFLKKQNTPSAKAKFLNWLGGFNSAMSSGGVSWGAIGGDLVSGMANSFAKDSSKFSESQQKSQSAIRSALSAIPVYGQAIALATGIMDGIGSLTDTNLSNIDKQAASRQGLGGAATFNNAVNHLPGVSMLTYGVGALFGGGKSNNFSASEEAKSMSSGYSASVMDLSDAEELAGKNYFGGGWRKKANDAIERAKISDSVLKNINVVNTQRKQSDYYQDLQNQNINRYAGNNYMRTYVGKKGLKLISAEEARKIVALRKSSEIEKMQNGGKFASVDESIMPTGALHKELHHLGDNNPELAEDITKKGIPVVTVNPDGELEQIAEIERSEWTLSKSLTDRIEALFEQWKKEPSEELEIQCGELVVEELRTNTVDPGNQLNIENDGEK